MAYTLQLADIKAGPIKNIAASCPNSQMFIELINQAQRRLMKRGNFFDTEVLIQLCIQGCIVTWPNYVGTVMGVRFCDSEPANLTNHWYAFIGGHRHHRGRFSEMTIMDIDMAPCFSEVSGTTGKLIRYHVVHNKDIGKKITIFGTQYGGQPLQEKDANGNWINGLTITAAAPFATTTTLVTRIDAVSREATQGMAYVYEYDANTNVLRNLATYEPNETHPRYRRSQLSRNPCHGKSCANDPNGLHYHRLEALVKLAFVPLINDRDFLILDDEDALKLAVQAVKAEEANDDQTAEIKWAKAIRELNMRERDKSPDDQTPVRVNVVDGCAIRNPI